MACSHPSLSAVLGAAWLCVGCQFQEGPTQNVATEQTTTQKSRVEATEMFEDTLSLSSTPQFDVPPMRELMGMVKPSEDDAFAELPARVSSRSGLYLRDEACQAFIRMYDAAAIDGLTLTALSATRPFHHQASIWNRKWNRPQAMGMSPIERARDILQYSSMPGTSRHHWGTDVDIFSLEPSDFERGEGARILAWLREHAEQFGFVEVYTKEEGRPGYQPEAWHWSYLPLSGPFLRAINEAYRKENLPEFEGFEGASVSDSLRIVEDYINGINPVLVN